MKAKKLFAGLLAAVMTASAVFMSGCSGGNSEENAANTTSTRKIITLNMYIMTDEETDPEVAKQVQMEINKILLPEYKTMLKINYVPENEYWDTMDKVQDQVEYYRENGELLEEDEQADVAEGEAAEDAAPEEAPEEDDGKIVFEDEEAPVEEEEAPAEEEEAPAEEEVLESDGSVKGTKDLTFNELIDFIFDSDDITLENPQLDLFVVNDYDKYVELAKDEKLAPMDEYLNYDSSVLKQYIFPTFLSAARLGKVTYGIPTNHGLDSNFTYFVFNKDLLDKYGYEISELTSYAGLEEYLRLIKANEPAVWPVSGVCDIAGAEVYGDAFLAIAPQLNAIGGSVLPTFMETKYVNHIKAVGRFKEQGLFPQTPVANGRYAVEIVNSPNLLENQWTENGTNYAAYLYDVSRVSAEEAFKSAMVISSLSSNKDRAMELITLFNTNAELANLLQYGISGENYYYDADTESVTMLNNTYMMDTMNTGNTYIKYPLAGNEDVVKKAIAGNIQTAPSAFLGFNPNFDAVEDKSVYEAVKTICVAAQKAIDDGKMSVDDAVTNAKRELVALGCVYVDSVNLGGIFGKVVAEQKSLSAITADSFRLADEIVEYNESFGLVLEEIEKEEEAPVADEETSDEAAAEGETSETDTADDGADTEAVAE